MATSTIVERYDFLNEQQCSIEWPRSGPHKGGVLLRLVGSKTPYIGKSLNAVVELAMSFVANQSEGPAMKKTASRRTASARA